MIHTCYFIPGTQIAVQFKVLNRFLILWNTQTATQACAQYEYEQCPACRLNNVIHL